MNKREIVRILLLSPLYLMLPLPERARLIRSLTEHPVRGALVMPDKS